MTIPDTHAYIKRLEQAGFSEIQAEAQVTIWLDWIKADLATKDDLNATRLNIKEDIKSTEVRLKEEIWQVRQEIKTLEVRLMWRMVTLLFLQAGLIVALIKLLP